MEQKGLVHIYTGDGKGKTSAAFGLALRAAGNGKHVQIFQFLKPVATGEHCCASHPNIEITSVNSVQKLFSQMSPEEQVRTAQEVRSGLEAAQRAVWDVLILDEIFWVVHFGILTIDALADQIRNKPPQTELILTGRNAPTSLFEAADYVTEMRCIKHPYTRGTEARRGIEF